MARGRLIFSEHGRRAVSVPVDDLSYPDSTTTTKLHHIRSGAIHDADALTSASKRHDREFLHRVQSSLATPPTLAKPPPILSHHRGLRPPPSRSAYYTAAAASSAASSAAVSSAPHDLRRRTWYGPTTNRVDDYEVDAYLATPARPPYVSRSLLRAGSVPPVLPSAASLTGGGGHHWAPTSHAHVSRWTPPTYRTYGSGWSQLHSDLDSYGTGSSHRSRLSAFEHDLDSVDDYPRIPVATRVTSPYFAYRSSPLHGTHEDLDLSPPYHHHHHHHHSGGSGYSKHVGGGGGRVPVRSSSVSSYSSFTQPTHAAVATPVRFSTLGHSALRASSARRAPVASTEFDFDLDLSSSRTPVRSLSSLHHRTSSALDRHLPTESHIGVSLLSSGGSGHSHGSRSGSALVVGGHSGSSSSSASHSLTPVHAAPASSAAAPPPRSSKPQISETRQRVRSLLCKSKKDPHYFD